MTNNAGCTLAQQDWSVCGLFGKFEAISTVPPKDQNEEWKALKLGVKAANVPTWAQGSQESIWESRGKMGDDEVPASAMV
jgi:hypothetical protein